MLKRLTTAIVVLGATLALGLSAASAEILVNPPSRAEYVSTVDPICKSTFDTNKKLLKNVRRMVTKQDKFKPAAAKFATASKNVGKMIKSIEAVPRPTEDSARLEKWFKFLKIIQTNLGKIGSALRQENEVKANHEEIRTERSANAANNVSFVFKFQYCALKPSQF
jgi:hypothetical protein